MNPESPKKSLQTPHENRNIEGGGGRVGSEGLVRPCLRVPALTAPSLYTPPNPFFLNVEAPAFRAHCAQNSVPPRTPRLVCGSEL